MESPYNLSPIDFIYNNLKFILHGQGDVKEIKNFIVFYVMLINAWGWLGYALICADMDLAKDIKICITVNF